MGRKLGSKKNDDFKDWIVEVFSDDKCEKRIKYTLYSSAQKIAEELNIPLHKVYNHYYERVKPTDELKFIKIKKTENTDPQDLDL
jgi:hypothetical protein